MQEESTWEDIYKHNMVEELPWFSPELDIELKDFLGKKKVEGLFLDLGTGPGTQAIGLAKLGFDVIGTDISKTAIEKAKKRAEKEDVKIDFIVDDIRKTKLKEKQFDFIYDRGVFHSLAINERERFVKTIKMIIKDNGIYFLKCFSVKTPGNWGPYRFTRKQIKEYFGKDFKILSIKDSIYPGTLPDTPKTLFCIMRPK